MLNSCVARDGVGPCLFCTKSVALSNIKWILRVCKNTNIAREVKKDSEPVHTNEGTSRNLTKSTKRTETKTGL